MQSKSDFVVHLLTVEPGVVASLLAMRESLRIIVHASDAAARTRIELPIQRPDVLVVDADIGVDTAVELIQHVRNRLYNDWLPIVVLSSAPATRDAIEQRAPWAVDFHLPKPLTKRALQEHQVALRRMVALRRVSRSALDRVSEAVIVIDASGTIRSFNGAAESLFGWTAQEAVGANVSLLMPSPHRDKHPGYLSNYERTRHPKIIGVGRVETAVRKDGKQFPMHLTVADISDGTSVRFVGVIRDLSVYQQRDKLQDLIHHDSLTGLPNRAYATEVLAAAAKDPEGASYSVLFCDVDRFKLINDVHGHRVGDEVLKAIALRLRNAVSEKDFVARLAGDEFLIVLHGESDPSVAGKIAQRISASVSHPVSVGDLHVDCSVSIGAASATSGQTPQAVIEIADQQMYESKRARRAQRPA